MTDIVFLDTETLGLDPAAPVWEFAAIRRPDGDPRRSEQHAHFTIAHDPTGWLDDFPEQFARDYHARYDPTTAWTERAAALEIDSITRNAHIIGAVPSFDTERLTRLLTRHGITPRWHYHLVDIENVVVGWLAGLARRDQQHAVTALQPPWKSNLLSIAAGIDPADYDRHTAMGDVLWTRAQWDAVITPHLPTP